MQEFYTYNAPAAPSDAATMKKRMRTIAIICLCGAVLCGILSGVFYARDQHVTDVFLQYHYTALDYLAEYKETQSAEAYENYTYYFDLARQAVGDDTFFILFVAFLCIALAALIASIVCAILAAVYNSRMKAESVNHQPNYW